MTEEEMRNIHSLLWECGEVLVCFDERTADKKMLFATKDEPTMLRYILSSPVFTAHEKEHAQSTLDCLTEESEESGQPFSVSDDEHVLFHAPDSEAHGATAAQQRDSRLIGAKAINAQLLSFAPTIAQAFCCKASMIKFIKALVENAGYEPEIRDGGFYFPLFIEEDSLTWEEYFGVESVEEHGENVVIAPPQAV